MQYLVETKNSKVKVIVDHISPIPLPGLIITELRTREDYIMCLDVQDRIRIQNNITAQWVGPAEPIDVKLQVYPAECRNMWQALSPLFVFSDSPQENLYWAILTKDPFKTSSVWDTM